MAIDKNSKAYQGLLKKGYSDDQITQMYNTASAKGTTKGATNGVNPANAPKYDPMADLTPEYIANMDMNKQISGADQSFSQYGDDSSPEYQQRAKGGLNEKYVGEGVKNDQLNYDENLKLADLNPNFVYGQQSKVYGTDHPGYITQRNDQIASALYNEGKISREDVQKFLEGQQGFFNSSEADRSNTIEAVWKRIGDIQKQQQPEEPEKPSPEFGGKTEDQEGQIFGRASGDKETTIKTNQDIYSTEAINLRTRQLNYQSLQSMDSYDIALSLSSGMSLYGETAMRDLATYDPQKYQEVQTELKRIQQGDTVNAIASGEHGSATAQTETADSVVNDSINKWTEANSTERTYEQVQELLTGKLANSQTAQTATQEMLNIKSQIAELEEKMANLPKEAQKAFKGDVPQYIIDAFVSNNAQRYQSEINKLQSRYNSAIELYKTELAQKQWEAEMDLKRDQFEFTKNQQAWDNAFKTSQQAWENNFKTRQQGWTEYYQGQSLLLSNGKIKTDSKGMPYIINDDGTFTYLTDATYQKLVDDQVRAGIETLNATWFDGMKGGQCEAFSDSWTDSVYGQTMLPVDADGNIIQGRTWTYGSEKAQYVNSAVPKVGEVAIFKYPYTAGVSNAAKTYGHTMIVIGYDPTTQMITLKGSNKTGDEKVYTTQMSLTDFRTKYYGAGFWDPSRPTWFQKEDDGAVNTTTSTTAMNDLYGSLITNAGTEGARNVLSTAQTMYNVMAELKNDGSLEELISTSDFQKWLKDKAQDSYKGDDGGSEFGELLRKFAYNKNLSTKAKNALNRLQLLVEMKLRNESGAAISSSEWMTNFNNMIPSTFQDKEQMRNVLRNRDIVIRRYSVAGGMGWDEYMPIFDDERQQRQIFAG